MTPYAEGHAANVALNFGNNSPSAYTRHSTCATAPAGFRRATEEQNRQLRAVIHGELDNLDDVVATPWDVCLEPRQHRRLLQGASNPVLDGIRLLVRNPRRRVFEVWVAGWLPRRIHARDFRSNLRAWAGQIPASAQLFIRQGARL